jgi:hypothetical protein
MILMSKSLKEENKMAYKVFHRTWWKESWGYANGLEPCAGKKHYFDEVETEEEAREACRDWNSIHEAGRLSDKAEYEEV